MTDSGSTGSTVLSAAERAKVDGRDDDAFYDSPRYVQHVDDAFRESLAELYAHELAPDDDVLDLMSSWVSHLPDVDLGRVVGHGLNADELAANDRLDDWVVQNLNRVRSLPFDDASFDAVVCAVSVQYLQYPGEVFAEVARVLRPGGVVIVSFSNRMFPTKAVAAWRSASMDERGELVARYLRSTGRFTGGELVRTVGPRRDPFYAVLARRVGGDGAAGAAGAAGANEGDGIAVAPDGDDAS